MIHRLRSRCFVCLAGLLVLLAGRQTYAQSPPTDVNTRIEQLEKQNQELLRAIDKLQNNVIVQLPALTPADTPADVRQDPPELLQRPMEKRTELPSFFVGNDLGFTARWDNGLLFETANQAFKVHVGGRTQWDWAGFTADDRVVTGVGGTGPMADGINPRRTRIEIDGSFYEVIDFMAEYELLGNTFNADPTAPANAKNIANSPAPTELWATIKLLPWIGNVRVGYMKPPLSFEHLTSGRFLNFMERSFGYDTYIGGMNNGFAPGIQIFNWLGSERFTWAVGVFKNNQTPFGWNVGDGEYDVTGRLTWLPYYRDEGRYLVHVGLGASHRDLDDHVARLRAPTLLRNGPFALQTRLADVTVGGASQTVLVPEFAVVWGPWTVQSEWSGSWIPDATLPPGTPPSRGTYFTQSVYVELLYFLTGENRPYNKAGGSGAAFTRVVPNRNFFMVKGEDGRRALGPGAWQIGARFSWIDLDNNSILAGTLHDMTLGLNWYLNPNMKFQWNYSLAFRNAPAATSDGIVQGFGMRMAMDF